MESLLLGRTVAGRYSVEEVLGRGGMSVVYRAVDARLGRPVALKIVSFPPGITEEERAEMRERLRREASSAARLSSHPNVVQIYDHGTDEELQLDFITMELLLGEDVKTALRSRTIPTDEGLRILREATHGVAAGHASGI